MGKPIDETGNTHGLLTVARRSGSIDRGGPNAKRPAKAAAWLCVCECGNEVRVTGNALRSGHTRSCGCLRSKSIKTGKEANNFRHGKIGTSEYTLWMSARRRSREKGIFCDLAIGDLSIPETCPVLGTPIVSGSESHRDLSPSIDRINHWGGYTKGNIRIIGYKANRLKSNATTEETVRVAAYQMGVPDHLIGWANFEQPVESLGL